MRFLWCSLFVLGLTCGGCGRSTPATSATPANAKKPVKKTPNYKAPGPGSAQRAEFNSRGTESLGSSIGLNEVFINDLQSKDLKEVKTAIEELQSVGAKNALPQLEALAKSHTDADIRRRAQTAVDALKKRK